MKVFKLVLLALILSYSSMTKAQVSVNVNIGTPPAWGLVDYPEARYYYLPDIRSYYDIGSSMFIYMGPGGWIRSRVLPEVYAGFDLYNGCKVALTFRGDNPHYYYETHRVRYPVGYTYYPGKHDNGHHYGEYKHHKPKDREVIYVNDFYNGRRYDDHDDERRGEHGHGHGDHGNGHGHGRRD